MNSIYNYTLDELGNYFISLGDKKFRAIQIFEWLYRNRVSSFDEMTNLSKKVIEHLKENFTMNLLTLERLQVSSDGTRKYLFKLADGHFIESVLMRHNYGNSICVTSEVGCNMGCAFCASGELGCVRRLTLEEMVLQVLTVQKDLDKEAARITNVVVMGIGEPFDNYEVLLKFLTVINYPKGLEIGARHITVSTCGIVPKIKEFADFPLQINLALSLHAPNNKLRSSLMKINKAYPLEELMPAIKEYEEIAKRRVTYEYLLLSGINDSLEDAEQLAKLIKGTMGYVNLIPYNETKLCDYKRSSGNRVHAFLDKLTKLGVTATIRKEFGSDIDAACGQLKAKSEGKDL